MQIRHQDGAILFYHYAFLLRYRGFLLLFTEHHRWHVYDMVDLDGYAEFRQVTRLASLKPSG